MENNTSLIFQPGKGMSFFGFPKRKWLTGDVCLISSNSSSSSDCEGDSSTAAHV